MQSPLSVMKLTSPFGPRGDITLPDGSILPAHHHNGADYRAAVGTPIVAPEAGVIEKINTTARGALQLFLTCARFRFAFVHLDEALARVGQRVEQGQVIGLTGDSGGVAPHLHLEMRDRLNGGALVDPAPFFAGAGQGGGAGGLVALAVAAKFLL